MNREMQVRIKENKQRAAELISFANPKSKNRPTIERVTEIISRHIPYRIEKPVIINISIITAIIEKISICPCSMLNAAPVLVTYVR